MTETSQQKNTNSRDLCLFGEVAQHLGLLLILFFYAVVKENILNFFNSCENFYYI